MKLAYFSPLNPIRSGISDYSEDLLPHLSKLMDIDLFIDDFRPSNRALVDHFPIYPISTYPRRRWDYDMALYHIGNNLYHEAIYHTALRFPGVAVLHDYALAGILGSMTVARGNPAAFVREWGYAHGAEGLAQVRAILDGRASLSPDEPLNRRLIDLSMGLVVHSDYLRRRVLETRSLANVVRVPMLCVGHQPRPLTLQTARRELGLGEDGLYIGSFGFIVPSKQVEPLLDVFVDLLSHFPTVRLFFVGEPLEWYDPVPLIEERGLAGKVTITGYLPMSTWYTLMAAMDLAVNLRHPTLGETSAAVLRLLGEGVPTIVSDVGWYAELPDDCVVKVKVGEQMRADLHSAIASLLREPEQRTRLGQRGRAYVATHHSASSAAQSYATFLEEVVRGCASKDVWA